MRLSFACILILLSACSSEDNGDSLCADISALEFVEIPAGEFTSSTAPQYPEENRSPGNKVSAFKLMAREVTNADFKNFVSATGYVTDAEKSRQRPDGGSALFTQPLNEVEGRWSLAKEATWRTPDGPGSSIDGLDNHPVVHVSYQDATAYADWVNARLPTELEWQYAAQLGLPDPSNPSSGAYGPNGEAIANTWQGIFPIVNAGTDGYRSTAPAGCYAASEIGLYDMIGNVWEWTSTPYSGALPGNYTIKGGSYLCANNFCQRYRPMARQPHEQDFSTNHIGFRLAKDI